MPYKVEKKGVGFKVTSPNHPAGFSKHTQTKGQAEAQERAILANAKPEGGKRVGVRKKKG